MIGNGNSISKYDLDRHKAKDRRGFLPLCQMKIYISCAIKPSTHIFGVPTVAFSNNLEISRGREINLQLQLEVLWALVRNLYHILRTTQTIIGVGVYISG